MVHSLRVWLVLLCSSRSSVITKVDALYVSYEHAVHYRVGDTIQLVANKLTSPTTFSSMDYQYLPFCNEGSTRAVGNSAGGSSDVRWQKAVSALHGDAFRSIHFLPLTVGQDLYCAAACELDFDNNNDTTTTSPVAAQWKDAIARDFVYNFYLDGLPVALRTENDATITTRYWGGVPVGRRGGYAPDESRYNATAPGTVWIYNHYNIRVEYRKDADDSYQILRTILQPYSVQQQQMDANGTVVNVLASCNSGGGGPTASPLHTSYDMMIAGNVPVQPVAGKIRFTYDVAWIQSERSFDERWDVFLAMDDDVPAYVGFMGLFLGVFILLALVGALYTWVMRDLSYKPLVREVEDVSEDEVAEIEMWPLSTRIFFPPTNAPILLCIACGTGAQLLVTGFCIVVLFRVGIISQAQGAHFLTPCIILYTLSSLAGGYVTARLYAIFHGDLNVALASCLVTAIAYPLAGLLVSFLVYDVLPNDQSPSYGVASNSTALILLWIFLIWPLTVIGGYIGHRAGAIEHFPVSQGLAGYQDLALQDDSKSKEEIKRGKWVLCMKKSRIALFLVTGGLLPVLSCFVNYSFGVAGPIFLGYYSLRAYAIASFLLFVLISGVIAVLLYYRQIRTCVYQWWWAAFASAGSAGVYIFLLSLSYMLFRRSDDSFHVTGNVKTLFLVWFAYISFGVTLMTGFVGVALCMWFNRAMYMYIARYRV